MFIVFNRAKINSYLISIGTVMILFSMTFMINKNIDVIETSTSTEEINNKINDKTLLINNNMNFIVNSIENIQNDISYRK